MVRGVGSIALALALLMPTPSNGGVPVPWVPSNAGVLWYQTNDQWPFGLPRQPPGDSNGAWYLTRRLAIHPTLPGVMHLGSFFHGMYASTGVGGWAPLNLGCWTPIEPPPALDDDLHGAYRYGRSVAIALTGMHGCAIEGIAYDPLVATRMYAAAYDVVSLKGTEPTLGDAGIYVSDNLGVSWRRLIGGLRGNGLAVARTGLYTTIVAGFIQTSNGSVGSTPNNGSLVVSRDDGASWDAIQLPNSGCADTPGTSQRITPTIAFNPVNANQIFAGTNAGLYVSNDTGRTWSLTRLACGGVWGIALAPDGSTIYIGDKDGRISRAPTSTLSFTQIAALGSGKVQSLVLDQRDHRTLYAAMWAGNDANVFRVPITGGAVQRLDDSLFRDVLPVDQAWPPGVPKPFPISFKDSASKPAPSLFLAQRAIADEPVSAPLWVSTIFRGVFVRGD